MESVKAISVFSVEGSCYEQQVGAHSTGSVYLQCQHRIRYLCFVSYFLNAQPMPYMRRRGVGIGPIVSTF